MKRLLLMFGVLVLGGCSTVQKDYGYVNSPEYQNRPKLNHALISANPSDSLSEAAIQKILSSKVTLPKTLNLAIVRLSESVDGVDFQTVDEEQANQFYKTSNWGTRVRSVTPVPEMMIPRPVTLNGLRQAAVLLQADALVVVKPVSYGESKFQWFDQDKAKGVTSLQVLLLDTRTSVVPYTSLVTETSEIKKEKSDYNDYELKARAKKASEVKALLKVAPEVKKFLTETLR